MLETNIHFTPQLLICAAGDLAMSNLVYTAHLLELERPIAMVSTKISCLYIFIYLSSWVQGWLV